MQCPNNSSCRHVPRVQTRTHQKTTRKQKKQTCKCQTCKFESRQNGRNASWVDTRKTIVKIKFKVRPHPPHWKENFKTPDKYLPICTSTSFCNCNPLFVQYLQGFGIQYATGIALKAFCMGLSSAGLRFHFMGDLFIGGG